MVVVLWLTAGFDWQDGSILVDNIIQLLSINVSSQSTEGGWSIELRNIWDLNAEGVVGGESDCDSLLILNGERGSRITDSDGPGTQFWIVPWGENLDSIDESCLGASIDVDCQVVKVNFNFGNLGDVVTLSWQLVLSSH